MIPPTRGSGVVGSGVGTGVEGGETGGGEVDGDGAGPPGSVTWPCPWPPFRQVPTQGLDGAVGAAVVAETDGVDPVAGVEAADDGVLGAVTTGGGAADAVAVWRPDGVRLVAAVGVEPVADRSGVELASAGPVAWPDGPTSGVASGA